MNRLRIRADIEIFSELEYYKNLEVKRGADILIDDVVNNTFNKTAIEGCCFGLAVVSSSEGGGWVVSDIPMLEHTLLNLLDRKNLEAAKEFSRNWVLTKYHPRDLTNLYCQAYEKILQ